MTGREPGEAGEPGPMGKVDQVLFRRAAGRMPTGIAVIATSLDGAEHAMTVSAFTSVSLEPPLVLFCAQKIARFHETVIKAGFWSVSVLGSGAERTATWLATRGRPLEGQLDQIPHHPGPATGAPLLEGALATLECLTTAIHDGGDHSIIVGLVVAASVAGDELDGPLIHFGGSYRRLAGLPSLWSCSRLSSGFPGRCVISSSPRSWPARRPLLPGWSRTTSMRVRRCPVPG